MTTTLSDAPEEDSLERRLWSVATATEDGRVRGHITECTVTDAGDLAVSVHLPNNDIHTETFAFPQADTREYAFVRLVEDCGYSLGSVEHLVDDVGNGAAVWCEPIAGHDSDSKGDDWRIVVPEYTPPLGDRLRERLAVLDSRQVVETLRLAGGVLLLPLLIPVMLLWLVADDELDDALFLLYMSPIVLAFWGSVLVILSLAIFPVVELLFGVELPGVEALLW